MSTLAAIAQAYEQHHKLVLGLYLGFVHLVWPKLREFLGWLKATRPYMEASGGVWGLVVAYAVGRKGQQGQVVDPSLTNKTKE